MINKNVRTGVDKKNRALTFGLQNMTRSIKFSAPNERGIESRKQVIKIIESAKRFA